MSDPTLDQLRRDLDRLEHELTTVGPVMRGSVTRMGTRHKQPYLSVSIRGKTRVIYLGDHRAVAARAYTANYRRLMELLDQITLVRMQLLKAQSPHDPAN